MILAAATLVLLLARVQADAREIVRSLTAHCGATLEDEFVVVGGAWGNEHASLRLPMRLRSPDAWSNAPALGRRCDFAAATTVDGRIYVLGGIPDDAVASSAVASWDGKADSWRTHAPMPTARNRLACASVDGRIYAVGGMDERGNSSACERFDPSKDRWERLDPMPTPRHGLALVVVGDDLLALGGEPVSNAKEPGPVEVLDTTKGHWERWPGMPGERLFFGAIAVRETIYVFGGRGRGASSSWKLDRKTRTWSESDWPPPMDRGRFAWGIAGKELVIVGGEASNGGPVQEGVLRLRIPAN